MKEGGYNRESGKKTLALVAVLIIFVVLLSTLSLFLLTHN